MIIITRPIIAGKGSNVYMECSPPPLPPVPLLLSSMRGLSLSLSCTKESVITVRRKKLTTSSFLFLQKEKPLDPPGTIGKHRLLYLFCLSLLQKAFCHGANPTIVIFPVLLWGFVGAEACNPRTCCPAVIVAHLFFFYTTPPFLFRPISPPLHLHLSGRRRVYDHLVSPFYPRCASDDIARYR